MKRKLIRRNKQYLSSQMKPYTGYLSWQKLRLYEVYICPITGELYKRKATGRYMWLIKREILEELLK